MARISSQVEDATLDFMWSSQDNNVCVKIVGTRKFFRNRQMLLDTFNERDTVDTMQNNKNKLEVNVNLDLS